MRPRGVAAVPAHGDIEHVGGGHDRPGPGGENPGRPVRRGDVQCVGGTRPLARHVQDALLDHQPGPAVALLTRLEHEDHVPGQPGLAGNVIFMFQPGEEGYGGARLMIEEGVLDMAGERPGAAYALHVAASDWPAGVLATRPGTIMAAADVLDVTVRGHGGHASRPHLTKDPIPAACEMVTALQTLVTRRFDVFDPVVVTVSR